MSIYDRFKNQPLMRMQDGGTPTDAENTETVDVEVVGIPKYPYGHPSEAVENLHDRRRDINESIKKGYYRGEFLDDNPKTFKALLNELKMIDFFAETIACRFTCSLPYGISIRLTMVSDV